MRRFPQAIISFSEKKKFVEICIHILNFPHEGLQSGAESFRPFLGKIAEEVLSRPQQ